MAANVPRQLPPVAATSPSPIRTVLEHWCLAGATGALRILGPPGGVVFLVDGRIAYAECPLASGLAELLLASGRVSPDGWAAAVAGGQSGRPVGDVLVERLEVTGAELELAARAALLGAALFHLNAEVPAEFEAGARHRVGAVRAIEFDQLCTEVDRRHRLLSEAWPDDAIDSSPVRPVRRLPGHHVGLTSTQWAIVANAGSTLSPIELARVLGHDTFAILLEARRLARAGLIEVAPPAPAELGIVATAPPADVVPLPRRRAVRTHPLARRYDDPDVPVVTLLRIRRGLEARL